MLAASVVSLFQGEIGRYAVLAVLMPIVAGMGGNAGTQTLAVTVRALATNQLTESNTSATFGRELTIAFANGLSLGVLVGVGVALIFANPLLGAVMGAAMVINNLVAGLAGVLVPVTLDRFRIDPGGVVGGVCDDLHRRDSVSSASSGLPRWSASAVKPIASLAEPAKSRSVPQLHLTKVAFGCANLEALEKRVARSARDGEIRVATRMRPKRADELHRRLAPLDRQAPDRSPGSESSASKIARDGRIDIVCSDAARAGFADAQRAHQGWRYLEDKDAPTGDDDGSGLAALPPRLYGKLPSLALV